MWAHQFFWAGVLSPVPFLDVLSQHLNVRARLAAQFTGHGRFVLFFAVIRKLFVRLKAATKEGGKQQYNLHVNLSHPVS